MYKPCALCDAVLRVEFPQTTSGIVRVYHGHTQNGGRLIHEGKVGEMTGPDIDRLDTRAHAIEI